MNRVLQYLNGPCACCRTRERVERLAELARDIEATTGNVLEVIVPSADRLVSDGPAGLRAFIAWESEVVLPDSAAADIAIELRAFADSINAAADALCAGGAA